MRTIMSRLQPAIEYFQGRLTVVHWAILRVLAALFALCAVAVGVYFAGYPLWRRWQSRAALAEAGVFAGEKDYRSTILALRRAGELEPTDLATWRAVERNLAEIDSPEVLVADERLARLAPRDAGLRLAFVQDAIRFGRFGAAEEEMAGLDAAARRDVAFHRLAAALATALGRSAELETHLAAIVAAEPRNANARFTYAALRLWSIEPDKAMAARAEMDALLADPATRIRAAIELMSATARRREAAAFQLLMARLLDVFAPGTPPDFSRPDPLAWEALLRGMRTAAAGTPADAALLARWLYDLGRGREAIAWLATLPAGSRDSAIVLDVAAELNAEAGDLGALDALLRRGAWGPVPGDAVALALAAHSQRLRFDAGRGRSTWGDAVAASGASVEGLRALARLAEIWRETDGVEQALQAVLDRAPQSAWAYQALRNVYVAGRDLPDLWRLYGRWASALPDDTEVVAEWIVIGCILNRAGPEAYARAATLRNQAPHSRLVAIATAATLWRQNQPGKAWSALSALPGPDLRQPPAAFWVALVQADLGHAAEAAAALSQAYRADMSEPEKALLRMAEEKIAHSVPQ